MSKRDYYEVLGVEVAASADERLCWVAAFSRAAAVQRPDARFQRVLAHVAAEEGRG